MTIKIALSTATALGMLMGGAMANDSNTLFLLQQGAGNSASVHQSTGGGNNDIGLSSAPIEQIGDNNRFTFSNAGCCNESSRYDNDVIASTQEGNGNWINIGAWNLSNRNRVNDITQEGNTNALQIEQNGSVQSIVGTVFQDGNTNGALLRQAGQRNEIRLVQQVGESNGISHPTYAGIASALFVATRIVQSGNDNLVAESSIYGDDNGPTASNVANPAHDIRQRNGNNNGQIASTAITWGSDSNFVRIDQNGSSNNFDVFQGFVGDTSSVGNVARIVQWGSNNSVASTQAGSDNNLNAEQVSNGNIVSAIVTGNGNGNGSFTNSGAQALLTAGGALHSTNAGLGNDSQLLAFGNGSIVQRGLGNHTVNLTIGGVTGSSNNKFAFLQTGGSSNTINATIKGSGSNEAVGIQNGSNNLATLTQDGGTNVAVFQQIGSGNVGTFSQ